MDSLLLVTVVTLRFLCKMDSSELKIPDYYEIQDSKKEWKTMNSMSLRKRLPAAIRMLSTNSSKFHDLRNPSVPPSLANEGFQDLKGFSTYIFITGSQHAFLPPFLEAYNLSEDSPQTLLQNARYISYYSSQNASSIYRAITSSKDEKFLATRTLLNFTKTSPVNLTCQVQLLVDMLAMNEHNNEAIEGIIVLPRLDAITKPLGFFTWDPRSIVRDLLPFAKDVRFFHNVHMLRIFNNAHDSLAMDPVHMDIGLASIRVSSHAKRSIRNVLISSNIMSSGQIKSRDLHTSMNFVLDDASLDEPKAAQTNVAHVRVDIHEDLIPEFYPEEIFVILNKLVIKKSAA